ncbi:MAG: enoyl-CoA hydratase [Alphaproteobacteria bacterium]|nr:MAG: enoyl-CoA hydratase [Alphaproteobacteria bacterium]
MTDDIKLIRQGAIGHLVLNRPDKLNALNKAMWAAIPALLKEAETDKALKVLLVHGADERAFAAGADISEFGEVFGTREAAKDFSKIVTEAHAALHNFPKPTIARVEGRCIGGGCGLALCCDLRFAAKGATFGITPAKLGLAYRLPETKRLVDLVGAAKAKDILFSGRLLSAEESLQIGLIDRLFDSGDLEAETEAYCALLAQNSQYSIRSIKRIVNLILEGTPKDTAESLTLEAGGPEGDDFKEGTRAFLEKRKPVFPYS